MKAMIGDLVAAAGEFYDRHSARPEDSLPMPSNNRQRPGVRLLALLTITSHLTCSDQAFSQENAQVKVRLLTNPIEPRGQTIGGALTLSRDGTKLASSYDRYVLVRDVASGRLLGNPIESAKPVCAVAFSPDQRALAVAGYSRDILLWDLVAGKPRATLRGHTKLVSSLVFDPEGRFLVSTGDDQKILVWDVVTGAPMAPFPSPERRLNALFPLPDGKTIIGVDLSGEVSFWEPHKRQQIRRLNVSERASPARLSATYGCCSRDGRLLAVSTLSAVHILDTDSGTQQRMITDESPVSGLDFSPDRKLLASCGRAETVRLWDVPTGRKVTTLSGHRSWVNLLVFSPDGKTLITSDMLGEVRLWDVSGFVERRSDP